MKIAKSARLVGLKNLDGEFQPSLLQSGSTHNRAGLSPYKHYFSSKEKYIVLL